MENPSFVTNQKGTIKLESKKTANITVNYKAQQGFESAGRIVLESSNGIQWIFYLQGLKE